MEVAQKLIKLIKNNDNTQSFDNTQCVDYIEYIEDRPFNDKRYFISNDKLINLGWEQTIKFDDGLKSLL